MAATRFSFRSLLLLPFLLQLLSILGASARNKEDFGAVITLKRVPDPADRDKNETDIFRYS
jgi:hypothetical protein